jgi:hypothetical protein
MQQRCSALSLRSTGSNRQFPRWSDRIERFPYRAPARSSREIIGQISTIALRICDSPVPYERRKLATSRIILAFHAENAESGTRWRRGGDSNPRDPFESTRVPGVRLKPGSATSPRDAIMHHTRARSQFVSLRISARRSDRPPHTDENAPASESAARVFWRTRPSGEVSRLQPRTGA